jgi:hypothetical protein
MTARTLYPASRAVKSVLKPMNPVGPVIYKRVRKELNHVLVVGMEHTKIISIMLVGA